MKKNQIANNQLTQEAIALYNYIHNVKPPNYLVSRYVNIILNKFNGRPLRLPNIIYSCPKLIYLIEPLYKNSSSLQSNLIIRLRIMSLLIENDPPAVTLFYNIHRKSWPALFFISIRILVIELFILPIRLILSVLLK